LGRIYETHWDSLLNLDPSTLGRSAAKINRPAPSSLKKVDYYPAADLMYLVLEVRLLECWRYGHGTLLDESSSYMTYLSPGIILNVPTFSSTSRPFTLRSPSYLISKILSPRLVNFIAHTQSARCIPTVIGSLQTRLPPCEMLSCHGKCLMQWRHGKGL
jgi:hypothetical protein